MLFVDSHVDSASENKASSSVNSSDSDNSTEKRKNNTMSKMEMTTEFELVLTEEEWNSIKHTVLYGKRETIVLKRSVWTNVIAIAVWKQHKTRCAFVY